MFADCGRQAWQFPAASPVSAHPHGVPSPLLQLIVGQSLNSTALSLDPESCRECHTMSGLRQLIWFADYGRYVFIQT